MADSWKTAGEDIVEINKRDSNQKALLNEFLGLGFKGALKHIPEARIPVGLKKETLEAYLRLANAALSPAGRDPRGVQKARKELIEKALCRMQDPASK